MSSDVPIVLPVPLAFYRLGIRICQTERLHQIAHYQDDSLSRLNVTSLVELLESAAEELRQVTASGRILTLLEEAAREWRCWAAGGYEHDRSSLPQHLVNLRGLALHLAQSQGPQAQLASSWFRLGAVIPDFEAVPRRFARASGPAGHADCSDDPESVYEWAEGSALEALLRETKASLAQLLPPDRSLEERLPILDLPEELRGWHHLEAGLLRLTSAAPPPLPYDRDAEERDAWLYQLRSQGVDFKSLLLRLKQEHPEWRRLTTPQAVQSAIKRYAQRQGLPDLIRQRSRQEQHSADSMPPR